MDVSTPAYRDAASSSPISSPPLSIQGRDEAISNSNDIQQSQPHFSQTHLHPDHVIDISSDTSSAKPTVASTTGLSAGKEGILNQAGKSAAAKTPRPRKKKEETATADGTKPAKAPRKPRDPNAPPRKKTKKAEDASSTTLQPSKSFGTNSALLQGQGPPGMSGSPSGGSFSEAERQRNVLNQTSQPPTSVTSATQAQAPTSAQLLSRGQRFDPIRSASAENARLANPSPSAPKPQSPSHARASPSIASLIDPTPAQNGISTPNFSPKSQDKVSTGATSGPVKVEAKPKELVAPSTGLAKISNGIVVNQDGTDQDQAAKATINGKSATSSRAQSPKPGRKKKEALQLPPGNGLLSNSAFGKSETGERVFAEVPNQCIVIEVPITGETGNYVNFIKEVENKYGFDVAHPRQAEHRRRMAEMAAAGAALEPEAGSADEMALDGSDVDSNVEMGGVGEDSPSAGGEATKKKRARRGDEYDKNDDFIDDTEQAWEERAMASRDGYFVWSGPLVQEEDKPNPEKTDGPPKRGRGSRGRGGSTRGESSGRGRGTGTKRGSTRGSRGGAGAGTAARKTRITKAEQKEREAEKNARESLAANMSKEPSIPTGIIGM